MFSRLSRSCRRDTSAASPPALLSSSFPFSTSSTSTTSSSLVREEGEDILAYLHRRSHSDHGVNKLLHTRNVLHPKWRAKQWFTDVKVESWSSDPGFGFAHINNKPTMLFNTIKGERVDVQVASKKRNKMMDGVAVAVIEGSPDRIRPLCSFYGYCGGCQSMHMQHAAQIRLKEETLVDQLQRIGKLEIEVDARRPTDHSRSTGTRSGGIDEADDARSSISHCNSGSTLHRHIDANSSVLQPAIVNRSLPVLSAAAPSDASSCFALSVEGGGTDGHDGDSSTFGYRSRARLSVNHHSQKGLRIGFRERFGKGFVADIDECKIMRPIIGRPGFFTALRQALSTLSLDTQKSLPQIELAIDSRGVLAMIFRHLNPLTMKEKQILVDFGKDLNGANDNEASSGSYHSNSYNQRGKAAQVWLYLQSKGPSTVIPLYQGSSDSVETEEEDKDAAAALSAATSVPVSGVVSLSSSPLSERENADIDRAVHDIHFANDDTGDDANAPGSTSCDNGDRDTRSETKRDQRSRGKKDRRRGRDKNKSGGTFSKKEEQGKGHPHLHLFKPLISSLNIIRTESNHTRMNVDTGSDRAGGVSVRYFPVAVDACSVSAANNSAIVVSEGGYSNTTHSSSNSSSDRSQNEGVGAQSQQQRQLLSFNLRYFPMDFMQINANVNQQMICKSLNLLDPQPDDLILDLFCGLGNFGIPIAGCIKAHTHAPLSPSSSTATAPAAVPLQVLGFDVDEGMIMRANDNAKQNDLSGDMIQFFPANLYEEGGIALLKAQVQRFTSTDASAASETSAASVPIRGVKVVIDPPRSGALELLRDDFFWQRADADIEADDCGNGNSEHRGGDGSEKDYGSSLQSRRWEINRIVYVSCNPATFARDADILVNKHGFRLSQTGIADMFPHTSQSECVSLFER